jgi:DNA helicase-4
MVVVHEDGDPGVITSFDGASWRVAFSSGYRGDFPRESVRNKIFVWFPSKPRPEASVRGDWSLESKLALLSKLVGLIEQKKDQDSRNLWATADCADWFPRQALDALIRRRETIHIARERAELKTKIVGCLNRLEVEKANQLYDEVHAKAWWPVAEFDVAMSRAIRIREFVHVYPRASLSDLDVRYEETFAYGVSAADYAQLKLPKLRLRLSRIGMPLDEDQLLACARPERHRLISARAGSGKTRTLAAHAALTIQDELLEPDQLLILAFNQKAALEIGDRVRGAAGIAEFRNARTFHSLAWQLADHAGRELIFDDGSLAPSRRRQSGFVERLVESIMNPAFRERLYEFFRRELEQLDRLGSNLSKEEYVAFRRSTVDLTLGGETVKSNGEKFIADFLFEHGIAYKYEKVWSWDKQDRLHNTAYRPDFSIMDGGRDVILEHWAINPNDVSSHLPGWWETKTQDYRDQIEDKREFWAKRNVELLESHAGMLAGGRQAFEGTLQALLEGAGIRCQKVGHDELVRRVAQAPRTVSRMAELFLQFISRAKKRGWTVDDAARVVRDAPDPEPRNRVFHELAVHAYAAYERRLAEQSAMDFDDLLISATERVKRDGGAAGLRLNKSIFVPIRDLRWILIDEFQDFSELYYRLINAILEANPAIRVVAVGDDWQAINGFAGAQLIFFNRFAEYFRGAGSAIISTNRRSGRAIVGAGNLLMEGRGSPARAHRNSDGKIDVLAVDSIHVEGGSVYSEAATNIREDGRKQINWELARALKACAEYIAASVFTDSEQRWLPSVLILARTGIAYGVTLAELGKRLERVMRQHRGLVHLANEFAVGQKRPELYAGTTLIEVMTAHKAKGKEADTVIVLEALARQFPKVHADNQLFGPFGVTTEDVLAEERRLFYVATTRAEHRLMLLTETGNESPYIGAFEGQHLAKVQTYDNDRTLGAEAQALRAHLDQIDPESLIRQNVSQQALSTWDRLADQSMGLPEVGYFHSKGLYAELAWPTQQPRVAILTGRHKADAARWQQEGWIVHSMPLR